MGNQTTAYEPSDERVRLMVEITKRIRRWRWLTGERRAEITILLSDLLSAVQSADADARRALTDVIDAAESLAVYPEGAFGFEELTEAVARAKKVDGD